MISNSVSPFKTSPGASPVAGADGIALAYISLGVVASVNALSAFAIIFSLFLPTLFILVFNLVLLVVYSSYPTTPPFLLSTFLIAAEKEKNNNAKINYNLISTIQSKISNKLELLNNTFDIYLKLEDIILKWTKELFNIEKEKLSSFTKIKNLNKNTETTEDDIMNIIDKINSDIKANPNMIHDAKESLRIEGYDGKRFNEEKE